MRKKSVSAPLTPDSHRLDYGTTWQNEHFPGAQASLEGGGGGNLGAPGSANATCPRVIGLSLPDQRVRCPATGACSSIAAALVAQLVVTDHELRS